MGCKFRSLTESIDTSARGRMMMQMLGSFAEFEREMIRERTRAGLPKHAKRAASPDESPKSPSNRGRKSSKPSHPAESRRRDARLFKIHRATISRFVSKPELPKASLKTLACSFGKILLATGQAWKGG